MENKVKLFNDLEVFISNLDISTISEQRKTILKPLIQYIQNKVDAQSDIRLNFICTHNSRRSHLSQVWAQTMAGFFDIGGVFCYSGGTEATALYPMVADTLINTGFKISKVSRNDNPVYAIKFGEAVHPIIGFSKTFDNSFNPQSSFAAVMVCSSAEENCPFIGSAEKRMAVTYEDPKAFDNTPQQEEKYHDRSTQIATEMYYIFSQIK